MTNDELLSRITVDPNICHGKPCVRGSRHTVEYLLQQLSDGTTVRQLLARHPELKADDLRAAFAYGVRSSRVKPAEAMAG
jgi:uncharacterized protein (DUF433 family)